MQQNGLLPSKRTLSRDYNVAVDPSTSNDFATGAYRALHSMVPNDMW